MDLTNAQTRFAKALLCWLLFSSGLVMLLNSRPPAKHAAVAMGFCLVWFWVVLCGGLMYRYRHSIVDRCRSLSARITTRWQVMFVLYCTVLALTEEAITTTITNTAPLYGVQIGDAYITASSNYLDVIMYHGVSLFVSFFVGWAVLLTRWRFTPFSVAILFGITGTLIEMLFGGPAHIAEYGMWAFVYGLMIWLPACTIPEDRPAARPGWYMYPLAVVLPLLFVFLFPLLGIISMFSPHHPKFHFPPIR